MPYKISISIIFFLSLFFSFKEERFWKLPKLPKPYEYGNIIINRTSEKNNVKPVVFSHWIHRRKYNCRVCHFEIEFSLKANSTEITEEKNRNGEYCGTCHNGEIVFGHKDEKNCSKCHNANLSIGKEKFFELSKFPKAKYGNGIDWVISEEKGFIKPNKYLKIPISSEMAFDKDILLESIWINVPSAVFSHKIHNEILDCNNCHPDIFNIQKKGTKDFYMTKILEGQFCGVCHRNVAFPINDCKRCHPKIKGKNK